jgi:hypothetical protein
VADRRTQILVLLATRIENLPMPVRRDHAAAGFTGPADPYAIKRVQRYGLDGSTRERERAIDAAIGAAERELRRFPGFRPGTAGDELAEANSHPYGWEIARRRMYAQFDYRALDVAVELLHQAFPGVPAASSRGLVFIEPRMPDPIRAPTLVAVTNTLATGRWADPRARAQRDRQVRRWAAQGRSLGEIAAELALSYKQVRRIVNGQSQAA